MTPPPSSAILPALSIAIGLPLTSTRRDASSRAVVESSSPSREARRRSSSSSTARTKNNVSRLYARRIMDDVELERSHPWLLSSDRSSDSGERHRRLVKRGETTTPPECNDDDYGWRRSADKLLRRRCRP